MLRNGNRAFLALLWLSCGLSAALPAASSYAQSEDQKLREQEEALLRQLTSGGAIDAADGSIGLANSGPDPRIEKLIDEQARAALAAIDSVKQRVEASKAQTIESIPEVTPFPEAPVRRDTLVSQVAQDETALARVTKLSRELGTRDSELENIKQERSEVQRRVVAAEGRASTLAKQVESLRAKLMVTETEVERLSRVIEARNKQVILSSAGPGRLTGAGTQSASAATRKSPNPTVVRERVIVREGKAAEDLPVVVVTADKANLRTGPGQQNSSLMAVTKGNRLVVENRQGAWYRVFTPNGVRAWISAEAVQLQRGGGAL